MAPRFFVNDPDLVKARRDPLTSPVMAGKPKRPAKEYADQGTAGPADYADPQNFKYPLHKAANVKAAIQHFSNAKNAGKYPADEQAAIWGRIKTAAGKFGIAIQERKIPMSKSMSGLERINQYLELSKGGPYIGPHGGKWADPQHKVSWKELGKTQSGKPVHEAIHEDYNTRGKVKGEPRHGNALYEPKLMREQFPQHTKQDHADAAKIHQEHAQSTAAEHAKLVHRADTVHGVTLNSRDDFKFLPKGMGEEIDALKEQSTKSSMAAKSHEAAGKAMKRNPRQAEPQAEEPAEKPTTPEGHQDKIARDTLKMPDAMAGVMGGPSKAEAQAHLDKKKGKAEPEKPAYVPEAEKEMKLKPGMMAPDYPVAYKTAMQDGLDIAKDGGEWAKKDTAEGHGEAWRNYQAAADKFHHAKRVAPSEEQRNVALAHAKKHEALREKHEKLEAAKKDEEAQTPQAQAENKAYQVRLEAERAHGDAQDKWNSSKAHRDAATALGHAADVVREHAKHLTDPDEVEDKKNHAADYDKYKQAHEEHADALGASEKAKKSDKSEDHRAAAEAIGKLRPLNADHAEKMSKLRSAHKAKAEEAGKREREARQAPKPEAPQSKTPGLDAMKAKIAEKKAGLSEGQRLGGEAHAASAKTQGMKVSDPGFHAAHTAAQKAHDKARAVLMSEADKKGKDTGTHPGYPIEAIHHDKAANHHRILASTPAGYWKNRPKEEPKRGEAPQAKPTDRGKFNKERPDVQAAKLSHEAHSESAKIEKMKPNDPGYREAHAAAAKLHGNAISALDSADKQQKEATGLSRGNVTSKHHEAKQYHEHQAQEKPQAKPAEKKPEAKPAPAPEKKPESGPTKKDQLDLFGGSKVKKSFSGIEGMLDYLRKSEPQALPTGEPSMGGSGAEQGGDVAGKGKVGGSPDSAPSKGFDKDGKAQGVSPGKTEKLSEDDEDVEAQLKSKAPKTLGKSMAMPAHQREMVAREHALAVSRLVRGQRDIVVGCGPGAPPAAPEPLRKAHSWAQGRDSRVVYSDASDQAVEQLLKSDPFYTYQAPTTKRDSILIHQVRECAACQGTFTKSLASCPHCGVGSLNPLVAIHGHEPVEELQKSRAPLLRPRVERDLYFGKK